MNDIVARAYMTSDLWDKNSTPDQTCFTHSFEADKEKPSLLEN